MDGAAAAHAEEAFRHAYASVFAEPPYNESEDDVAAAFRRFRSQTRKPAFRGALARTESGDPVGLAYGYPLSARTRWWDRKVGEARLWGGAMLHDVMVLDL
ncbi:hypothetical protein IPZ58_24470 [Streptomyces roseoverticillatus]|nr:hypothetical protein [Streptomyces roseoverticillatus]